MSLYSHFLQLRGCDNVTIFGFLSVQENLATCLWLKYIHNCTKGRFISKTYYVSLIMYGCIGTPIEYQWIRWVQKLIIGEPTHSCIIK